MTPLVESQTTEAAAAAPVIPMLRPGFPGAALRMMSDERLARLVAGGDRAAFGVVFARYHQELYRYCLSLLHDREDAADALQGTMLRALRALEGETRAIALRPWLYRVAHNEAIDLLRHRPPRADDRAELHAALDWGVEAGVEARARLRQLLLDLRELPERQRGALVMRELAGLDYAQIADALETSPAAAKQSVYEARRTLFELASGRDLDCEGIRSRLSEGDRRSTRARAVRAHLRACSGCRDFHELTASRRSALSGLIPGLPAGAAAELLGGFGSAGAGSVLAVKSLAALALAVAAGAGATQALPHATAGDVPHRAPHAATSSSAARLPAAPRQHRSVPAARHSHARAPAPAAHRHARTRPDERTPTLAAPATQATEPRPEAHHAHGPPARTPHAEHQPQAPAATPPPPEDDQGNSGRGPIAATTQVVVPQVQAQVQQVQSTVDTTVAQVQQALPVHTPPLPRLPRLPKRRVR